MLTYVVKRLAAMVPTMIGITFITFMIIQLAPGDPVASSLGGGGGDESGGSGGGEAQRKLADAIKAKKKLLGVLEPDPTVRVWDTGVSGDPEAGRGRVAMAIRARLGAFEKWPRALALDAGKRRLLVGCDDGSLALLDADGGDVVVQFEPMKASIWAVALSPDGAMAAAADTDGVIRLAATKDGMTLVTLPALDRPVRDLAFLPDGSRLLSACDDAVIRLHSVPAGAMLREFKGHSSIVSSLALAPGGRRFWSGGYDRKLREWDVETGAVLRETFEHGYSINDMAMTPDGAFLATASEDRSIRVFDLREGEGKKAFEVTAHTAGATAVAIKADGTVVFSGGKDSSVRSFDVATGQALRQSPDNTVGEVHALAVSPDGATLWSASDADRKTPVWKQYGRWLWKTARFDFDRSFIDDRPVMEKIWEAIPVTLGISALSIFLTYLLAIPLGVLQAVRRGRPFDKGASLLLFMLWSIPNFWLATLLITGFSSVRNWNLFPSVGLHALNQQDLSYLDWLADFGAHLVLPMIVATYAGFTGLATYMRTSMLETIQQDYVRTARAKGLSERVVIFKHALRNSLITMVTLLGTLLPALIGGSIVIEVIFTIRGMGLLGYEAILSRDYPVTMAITTISALLTLVGMLISDILYAVVDPRISHG